MEKGDVHKVAKRKRATNWDSLEKVNLNVISSICTIFLLKLLKKILPLMFIIYF